MCTVKNVYKITTCLYFFTATFDIELTVSGKLHKCIGKSKTQKYATSVVVDEIFQAREQHIRQLYLMKLENPELVFHGFGDSDQIPPVEETNVQFKYMDKPVFRWLFGNRLLKAMYVEGVCRYDTKLKAVIRQLKQTGLLRNCFQPIDKSLNVNVCVYRKEKVGKTSVDRLNRMWLAKNGGSFKIGDSVVANANRFNVKNSHIYQVRDVKYDDGDPSRIVGYYLEHVDNWVKSSLLEPTAGLTVDRYQGTSIDEPGNIHNVDEMSMEKLYVALSRFRRLSDIHLTWTDKVFQWTEFEKNLPMMLKQVPTAIGTIYCKQNDLLKQMYVGRTVREPEKRHEEHRKDKRFEHPEWTDSVVCRVLYCNSSIAQHRIECDSYPYEVEYTESKYIKRAVQECAVTGYQLLNIKHNPKAATVKQITPAMDEIGIVQTGGVMIVKDVLRKKDNVSFIKKEFDLLDSLKKKFTIQGNGEGRLQLRCCVDNHTIRRSASFTPGNAESRQKAVAKLEKLRDEEAEKLLSMLNINGPSQGTIK